MKPKTRPPAANAGACLPPSEKNTRPEPLRRSEWDFSRVPSAELLVCCYYEYARESPTILDLFEGENDPRLPLSHNVRLRDALREFAPFVTAAYVTGKRRFAQPWQEKPDEDRRRVCATFVPPPLHYDKKAPPLKRSLLRPFDRETCLNELGLLGDGVQCTSLDTETGYEELLVQIVWKEFTDAEIVESFAQWVKENRPTDPQTKQLVGRHSDKGHDLKDWRVRLDRLGLLRLRHHQTTEDAIQVLCKAFPPDKRPSKFMEPGEINREATKAVQDFRTLLPFLDPAELPRSWPMK